MCRGERELCGCEAREAAKSEEYRGNFQLSYYSLPPFDWRLFQLRPIGLHRHQLDLQPQPLLKYPPPSKYLHLILRGRPDHPRVSNCDQQNSPRCVAYLYL